MIQVQRRGYFICDVEYSPYNPSVGRARPVVLISIPDGTAGSYGLPGTTPAQPSKVAAEKKPSAKEGKKQGGAAAASSPTKQGKAASPVGGSDDGEMLNARVAAQGDLVRKLKTEKAAKPEIDEAVKKLLALKAEFKAATGLDWKPGMTIPKTSAAAPAGGSADSLSAAVAAQGDLVRKLKAEKAAKPDIDEAVKRLLALKAEYKTATGSDWKPGAAPVASPVKQPSPKRDLGSDGGAGSEVSAKIAAQGDLVRKLKADKKPKEEIDVAVKQLLELKAEFKAATGSDWQPAGGAPSPKKQDKQKK